ncbi:uncharacterized protein LOC127734115 [Mytilus californianus]|uniref:uncharacterized protein LOC127734115 n=1 Tax=Mytilus californianus TaxID=6549 RepID=UPI0022472660|nr:uncharacterized protein LOC127734115 [Mytilus californianus]
MDNLTDTLMDENEAVDLSDDDIYKSSDDIIHIENQECMPVLMDEEVYQNRFKLAIVLALFIMLIISITTMTFVTNDDFDGISTGDSEIPRCSSPFHGDISRLSRQLENISVLLVHERVSVYSYGKNIKQQRKTPKHICDQLHGEFERLKGEAQQLNCLKDTTDTIETGTDTHTLQQRRNIHFPTLSSSHYRLAYGNRCLTGHTDYIDVIFKLSLFHPNISDNGTLLFEFGLSTSVEYMVKHVYDYQMLTVKAFRCKDKFGICLEVSDEISSKIDVSILKQTSEWTQGQITMGLQSSRLMLMSENQNIYVGSKLNVSHGLQLWPVFGIYNSHLINMSFAIHSKDSISFNRTSLDPHLFISDDNNTISNWHLQFEKDYFSSFEIVYMYFKDELFFTMTLLIYLADACNASEMYLE